MNSIKNNRKSLARLSLVLLVIFFCCFILFQLIFIKAESQTKLIIDEPVVTGNLWTKRVTVFSNVTDHVYGVPVSTDIPENLGEVELYRYLTNDLKQRVTDDSAYVFQVMDTDDNGKNDTVSWIVPELSEVSFSVEGVILEEETIVTMIPETETTTTSTVTITTIIPETFVSEGETGITFDRNLDCHRCGKHKAPPLTDVNMTVSAFASETLNDSVLIDYYPNEWVVVNANGGVTTDYNSSYNKIEWDVGGGSEVSRWYLIRSPDLTSPPTKYYFFSELADLKSDLWMVIVSDPSNITTGYDATATAIEQQRKVFRNPRGQQYYYVFIKTDYDSGLDSAVWTFYKSSDGTSWSSTGMDFLGYKGKPPSLWIWEDTSNSRLVIYFANIVYIMGSIYVQTHCYAINDDSSDLINLWTTYSAVASDDDIHNPVVTLGGNGYLWLVWVDEFTNKGKQRVQIRVTRSNETYPTSVPGWETIVNIYGEDGSSEHADGLYAGTIMPKPELVPLTATDDVACVIPYYDATPATSSMIGIGLYYSSGIQEDDTVTLDSTIHGNLLSSSVAETGTNSDVFVLYKDSGGELDIIKWNISADSGASYGNVYNSAVDSLALSIDKTSNPDKLYAFYVKNGVAGDVFYDVTPVDPFSLEGVTTINDDSEALDYLSSSYQDWNNDSLVQAIYTRQTSNETRFVEVPLAPTITVISPQNTTYYNQQWFWANISLDMPGNVSLYSLDGGSNQTLTKLSDTYFYKNVSSSSGNHNITFYANDSWGRMVNSSTIYFTLASAWLEVNLTDPNSTYQNPSNPLELSRYSTFTVNATVKCKTDLAGVDCGSVSGSIRYNASGAEPNELINTIYDTPFYVIEPIIPSNTTTYDFKGITYPSTTSNATKDQINEFNPISSGDTIWDGVELTTVDYQEINTSDDSRDSQTGSSSDIPYFIFHFKLNESETEVYKINVSWEGYFTAGTTSILYVYNFTDTEWQVVGSHTATEDQIIYKEYDQSVSDLIENNYIHLLVESNYPGVAHTLYTNYVKVNVTLKGGGENPQSCGSLSQDQSCQLNWTINATGTPPQLRVIDVNFSSSYSSIQENHTDDAYVKITGLGASISDFTQPVINAKSSTEIYGSCSYTGGTASNMMITIQDNRTGTFTDSATDAADVYVNTTTYTNDTLTGTSDNYYFTVTGNVSGNYVFRMKCNATGLGNAYSDAKNLTVNPWLNVSLIYPNETYQNPDNPLEVSQYNTFNVNASVKCVGGDCGTVSGSVRYNSSGVEPNELINATEDTPFYIVEGGTELLPFWNYTYNGPGSGTDKVYGLDVDSTGNMTFVGYHYVDATNDLDWRIMKFYPNGTSMWNYTYDGPGTDYYIEDVETAEDVVIDSTGNIIVVGHENTTNHLDWRIMKFYPNGTSMWNYTFNGPYSLSDYANDVDVDSTGNITVVGSQYTGTEGYDWRIMKFYPNGTSIWNYTFNGPGSGGDIAYGLDVDSTGNITVVGYQYTDGTKYYDWRIMKFYPNGTSIWNYTYNGPGSGTDIAYGLDVDSTGNITVVGYQYTDGTKKDDWRIMKFYPNGTSMWNYTYNGPGNSYDQAQGVDVDSDGNIFIVGFQYTGTESYDWRIMKFYPNGTSMWNYTYNGPGNSYDQAYDVVIDSTGNITVVGYQYTDGTKKDDWRIMKFGYVNTNTQSCGSLSQYQSCQLNWTINATGNPPQLRVIDVNFSSSYSSIQENDTDDAYVKITSVADETKPYFSNNQTNTTLAGQPCNFTIDVIDDNNLDNTAGYIFSTNNSGTWTNSSYIPFTGSSTTQRAWNVTVLNSTLGALVQWMYYANDTSDNWNTSETYNLTTPYYISSCSVLDQEGATYYLTTDIINSADTICMDITANNVALDCQGHTIDGKNTLFSYAIRTNHNDTTVGNCIITEWYFGVSVKDSSTIKATIRNNTINSTTYKGIYLYTADNATIANNTIGSNPTGIYLVLSINNIIENNTIVDSTYEHIEMLEFWDLNQRSIKDNLGNNGRPIIYNNTAFELSNVETSQILIYASNCNLTNVTVLDSGIKIWGGGNTLTNVISSNNYYGLYLYTSDNNIIQNCTLNNNTLFGLKVESPGVWSGSDTIANNTLNSNQDGLYLKTVCNETVYYNKIENNSRYGIYLDDRIGYLKPCNIYNNLFNNTNNFYFSGTIYTNNWNTTKQTGTRIFSPGDYIGGNYWTNSTGNGFSDNCTDTDKDGFCDNYYELNSTGPNRDYLTLSNEYIECSYSITLSNALSSYITWGSLDAYPGGNATNASAKDNSDTQPFTEQGNTLYNVTVSVSGCSPNTMDVYMKLPDHVKCSSPWCGSEFIGVSNVTFDNKTVNGQGYPTCDGPCLNNSMQFPVNPDTWKLIGSNLADGTNLYLRIWICPYNETGTCNSGGTLSSGVYNTTFNIVGILSGGSPP